MPIVRNPSSRVKSSIRDVHVPTPVEKEVVLVIPAEYARTLLGVTHIIAGDPGGPRGHMDAISEALKAVGLVPDRNVRQEGQITLSRYNR